MGTFDDLTVEYPLPDGFDPAGISFQTKDTAEQYLVRYVLRADGTLWNTSAEETEELHGSMEFYASNWAGSCGRLYMTVDDKPPWSAEYVALFDHGRLLKIEGPGLHPVDGVEHVLRADWDRRCEEVRQSRANPGDDLHTEWVHWMTFYAVGSGALEAVRWPALGVRLGYLRAQCAWGIRVDDDRVQDLRDWSGWLAGEGELTPEAVDLLKRTQIFLSGLGKEAPHGS